MVPPDSEHPEVALVDSRLTNFLITDDLFIIPDHLSKDIKLTLCTPAGVEDLARLQECIVLVGPDQVLITVEV